jgi:hypothetical protein
MFEGAWITMKEINNLLMKVCKWFEDSEGNYESECENMFVFSSGTPKDNHFLYCPYCGNELVQELYQEDVLEEN